MRRKHGARTVSRTCEALTALPAKRQFPIVEIQNGGYEDKRYGWIDTPKFEIVGWAGRPDLGLLTGGDAGGGDESDVKIIDPAPPRDTFDDEIPF
jgi:hypothetical protein